MKPEPAPTVAAEFRPPTIVSLQDQVVKYDMRKMVAELVYEFDIQVSTTDLVDQVSISQIFKMKGAADA